MTMLTQEMNTQRGVTAWMNRLAQDFAKWRAYRATVEQLRLRNEHELEDLGMARGDIRGVARAATYGHAA